MRCYKISIKAVIIFAILGALILIVTFCSVYGEAKYSGGWYYAHDAKGKGETLNCVFPQ